MSLGPAGAGGGRPDAPDRVEGDAEAEVDERVDGHPGRRREEVRERRAQARSHVDLEIGAKPEEGRGVKVCPEPDPGEIQALVMLVVELARRRAAEVDV